jgi:hypothetical protein
MIRVFHGSNIVVREPLVGIGRENLDFGLGFCITRQEVVDRFLRFTDSYQVEAYVE